MLWRPGPAAPAAAVVSAAAGPGVHLNRTPPLETEQWLQGWVNVTEERGLWAPRKKKQKNRDKPNQIKTVV